MPEIPTFGHFDPKNHYVIRPSVYGILLRPKDKIVVIKKSDGGLFLPGGGVEIDETSMQALHREIQEELGCEILNKEFFARANEYGYSVKDDTYYFFPSEFYRIEVDSEEFKPSDGEHSVCWVGKQEAAGRMVRMSHAWVFSRL